MAINDNEVVSTLDGLIETCRDGEIGYKDAANGVQSTELKAIFTRFSAQRTQDISDLQAEVTRHGGDPQKGGSLAGALHRGWLNLKAAVTNQDDKAILDECERGEDVAVKAYKDALAKALPTHIQTLVDRQFAGVKQAHDQIKALRDSHQQAAKR